MIESLPSTGESSIMQCAVLIQCRAFFAYGQLARKHALSNSGFDSDLSGGRALADRTAGGMVAGVAVVPAVGMAAVSGGNWLETVAGRGAAGVILVVSVDWRMGGL